MPRIRDQGSTGFCTGFAMQKLLQFELCRRKNIADCQSVGPELEISPVSVIARCKRDISDEEIKKIVGFLNTPPFEGMDYHQNIQMKNGCVIGRIAVSANDAKRFNLETCYPLEQLAERFPERTKLKDYRDSRKFIESYFDQFKANGSICEACFLRDVKVFLYPNPGMKMPSDEVMLQSLQEDSYAKMWYILFNQKDCKDTKVAPINEVIYHPKAVEHMGTRTEDPRIDSYQKILDHINVAVVKNRKPIAIGVCMNKKDGKCLGGHAFVVSGFDRVCKGSQCRDVVKVENSWGEFWYPKNSDGSLNKWFDAKELFKYVDAEAEVSWVKDEVR
jgi:hypothetical protein